MDCSGTPFHFQRSTWPWSICQGRNRSLFSIIEFYCIFQGGAHLVLDGHPLCTLYQCHTEGQQCAQCFESHFCPYLGMVWDSQCPGFHCTVQKLNNLIWSCEYHPSVSLWHCILGPPHIVIDGFFLLSGKWHLDYAGGCNSYMQSHYLLTREGLVTVRQTLRPFPQV